MWLLTNFCSSSWFGFNARVGANRTKSSVVTTLEISTVQMYLLLCMRTLLRFNMKFCRVRWRLIVVVEQIFWDTFLNGKRLVLLLTQGWSEFTVVASHDPSSYLLLGFFYFIFDGRHRLKLFFIIVLQNNKISIKNSAT